jgi:hypothetical protein
LSWPKRPSYPEVSPDNPVFARKPHGLMLAGGEGARNHPAATAREGKPIVVKHRTSAFVENRSRHIAPRELLSAARGGAVEIVRRTGKSKSSVWCWQERFDDAKNGRNCASCERR